MTQTVTVSEFTEETLDADSEALIAETGAEIYFTTVWRAVWWAHYGPSWVPSRRSTILVVRDGTKPVAVLPFCIERFWVGPLPVHVARLAGVDPNFALVNLPVAESYARPAFEAAFTHLIREMRCHAISLSPISERSADLPALREAIVACRDVESCWDRSQRQHTLMVLPRTSDAFFASLSKSRRREHNRDIKRLTEEAMLETRNSTPETTEIAMDRFVAQHTSQWEEKGKGGHFADWPVAEQFHRALLDRLAPAGRAGLDELWLGETLLSSQLRYSQKAKAYWWLNARSIDPKFAKIGLGRVGLVERVGDLISTGIRTVDAGAGQYAYKLSYGGELVPVHDLLICEAGTFSRARVQLLMLWADALHLLYYRVWFLKLSPRLRLKPRPLWRAWVRSRF